MNRKTLEVLCDFIEKNPDAKITYTEGPGEPSEPSKLSWPITIGFIFALALCVVEYIRTAWM